jgi:hypothetical protein
MVTAEQLAARREMIAGSSDLAALARHIAARNARVLERLPPVPEVKALLSVDDGRALVFDPWKPDEHTCPTCGRRHTGVRHHRAWAKFQHLWLAERAVELAALAALGDGPGRAAARSVEILRTYGDRYFSYPNRDNVLGPSRLFFSTYLESIWILNYLGAAALLREVGALDEATARAVHAVADEAANLIGEYDEGFSNRQTWNNAALCAIAVWFEDEDLARRAIQSETGLVAHLRGYRDDGLWYEGENYHLFAARHAARVGGSCRDGLQRRARACGRVDPGVTRAGTHGVAGFHVPRAQGRSLWHLTGAAHVSGVVGNWSRSTHEHGSGSG